LGHKDKIMKTNRQLELGLKGNCVRRSGKTPSVRMARAQWWFARMREAVGGAMEWQMETTGSAQPRFFSTSREKLNA
jgi:hypothetical protein